MQQDNTADRRSSLDPTLQLTNWACAQIPELITPDSALARLTKTVINAFLETEMDCHLGYEHGDRSSASADKNERNGFRLKALDTDIGPIKLQMPRDRNGTFQSLIIPKRQRRLSDTHDIVLPLMADGLNSREAAAHMSAVYKAPISEDLIETFKHKLANEIDYWRYCRIDDTHPVVFIDSLRPPTTSRSSLNKIFVIAIAFTADGDQNILAIWAVKNDDEHKTMYWRSKLSELKERGLADVSVVLHDGLDGLSEAAKQIWRGTTPQMCASHLYQKPVKPRGLF